MNFLAGLLSWVLIGGFALYIISSAVNGVKSYLDRRKKRNGGDDKSCDEKGADNSN